MASLAMHLVIAQEYYEKHPNLKYSEFLRGTLQPDLEQDKNKSHYSRSPKNNNDIEEMLNSKVDIAEYVKANDVSDDYKMGEFLHLLTDYLFHSKYLIKTDEFRKSGIANLPQAKKIVYSDYDRVASILKKHYKIDFSSLPEIARGISYEKPELMHEKDVLEFIDYCSSMDLKLEHQKIAKGNVEIDFNLSKRSIRKTKTDIKKSNKQDDSL